VFALNRNDYFGPVCDDDWSDVAATVVCKQLGFSTGKATIESKFGRVPMDFAMDDVVCTGEEATIQECDYIWDDNCNSGEGAGVVCHGGDAETTTVDTPTTTTVDIATTTAGTEPTTTEIATTTMQAYYVELKDGNGYNSGNLFAVNSNGYFGPVCDDDWSDVAAAVVCKQLGFITGVAYWASHFGNVPSEFAMDNVECTGEEATIQDCDYVSTSDCSADEGAGVMCEFEGERDNVQLKDGNGYNTGNVFALNRNDYFGPVCDDDWSDVAATVVCKQLGFSTGKATIESKFGRVPMDFAMDDVVCTGEEATIQECDYIWDDNCNSGEGAGVVCHGGDAETTTVDTPTTTTVDIATTTAGTEPTTTEIATTTMQAYYVELKDGNGYNSGNLFAVNSNGYFGPVCDDDWSDVAAAVVCKQLGFITGVAYWASHFGNVPSEFAMDNVECTGEEATIQDCDYVSTSDCSVDEGAGVMCEFEGERDNVHLKDGNGYNTGNVFALNRNDYFGPVCDDDWSDVAATVVCKQLGFSTGKAVMGSTYGLVPSNFAMDDILCTGEEATIQECAYISHDDCNSNEGAGVVCE